MSCVNLKTDEIKLYFTLFLEVLPKIELNENKKMISNFFIMKNYVIT